MHLWRLCNGATFWDSRGAAGRWHPPWLDVIVLDASPMAAICAALEFAEVPHPSALPITYQLYEVAVPVRSVLTAEVPRGWRHERETCLRIGRDWVEGGLSLVLRVPALNGGHQYLLNAGDLQQGQCHIVQSLSYPFADYLTRADALLCRGADWLAVLPPLLEDTLAPSSA